MSVVRRRWAVLGLMVGGLALMGVFDAIATGPALGMYAAAAWLIRA